MSDKMEIDEGSLSPTAAQPELEQQPEQPQGSDFRIFNIKLNFFLKCLNILTTK